MTKYTEQFKLEVVQDYLAGGSGGLRAVAQRHGLPSHFTVRKWVPAYRLHGDAGLSKKLSRYSAEFKLSVLQHKWDNQLSITQAAARFDIRHHAVVGIWERAYRDGGIGALASRPREKPKSMATSIPKPGSPPR